MKAPASAYTVNTPVTATVAYERLGARNLQITLTHGAPNWPITSTLNTGVTLYMNLSGPVQFAANPVEYTLCANNVPGVNGLSDGDYFIVGDYMGASATTIGIPLTSASANIFAGATMYVTTDPSCIPAPTAQNLVVQVPASGAVGNGSLGAGLTNFYSYNVTYAANNLVFVSNQLTTTLSTADLIQIDYINSPANGTHIVPVTGSTNLIAMSPGKVAVTNNFVESDNVYPIEYGTENVAITLTDSAGWAGVSDVFLSFNGGCNIAAGGNFSTAVNVTSGTALYLTTPTGYAYPQRWQAQGAINNITICIAVSGNTPLVDRTISASYSYLPFARAETATENSQSASRSLRTANNVFRCGECINYQAPYGSGSSNTVWQTWTPNGYQAFCPYVYAGGGANAASNTTFVNDTFVRFVNASSSNATVFAEVYNGGTAPIGHYTLGVIAPYSSGTYWGGDLAAMSGIPYGTTFAAQYTVTALPTMVSGAAYYKRVNSSGSNDRSVPLLTDIMTPLVDLWPRENEIIR